jgi:hypothetical protein
MVEEVGGVLQDENDEEWSDGPPAEEDESGKKLEFTKETAGGAFSAARTIMGLGNSSRPGMTSAFIMEEKKWKATKHMNKHFATCHDVFAAPGKEYIVRKISKSDFDKLKQKNKEKGSEKDTSVTKRTSKKRKNNEIESESGSVQDERTMSNTNQDYNHNDNTNGNSNNNYNSNNNSNGKSNNNYNDNSNNNNENSDFI